MIQGRIDFASSTRIEGWIYSTQAALVGAKVLAFADQQCVGSGLIEFFRQDVVDAGFGDGMAGFSFAVYLDASHDPRILDVRLDGGSALIKQDAACLIAREQVEVGRRNGGRDPQSLSWMLSRQWLTQQQYEAMRQLDSMGIYCLRIEFGDADRNEAATCDEAALVAGDLLQSQLLLHIETKVRKFATIEDLRRLRSGLRSDFPLAAPVIGLWGPQKSTIRIVEGSHLDAQASQAATGIDYDFGDDVLLLVNLDCDISFPTGESAPNLVGFLPRRMRRLV